MTALVVDNRDSFVFNLVDDLARLGLSATVVRAQISLRDLEIYIDRSQPRFVLLSPGPGHPNDAGVMTEFLRSHSSIPVVGVCLGMQSMVCAEGGVVDRMEGPVHGRSSRVTHTDTSLFEGLPVTFDAGRYHSLAATKLPDSLEVCATDENGVPMAITHRTLPWVGLQFHPESVLTPNGPQILRNIIRRFQ